ncbi:hypothetical protein [Rhizobium binxianense]
MRLFKASDLPGVGDGGAKSNVRTMDAQMRPGLSAFHFSKMILAFVCQAGRVNSTSNATIGAGGAWMPAK